MERLHGLLRRLVVLQPGEAPALLASFATLLCTFSSYTILRPVRDALGITSGLEKIPYLFWGVFVVMLLLQPLYGWLTSRFPRSVFLPWVYGVLRRQPARLLRVVPPAGRPHLDRAHLLRVGERLQPVRRGGLLEPDGGRVQPRAGGTPVRLHLGGRQHRRPHRPADRRTSSRCPSAPSTCCPISAGLLLVSLVFMTQVIRWQRRQRADRRAARGRRRGASRGRCARRRHVRRVRAGGALAVPARHRGVRAAHDLGVDVPLSRAAGVRGQGVRQRRRAHALLLRHRFLGAGGLPR